MSVDVATLSRWYACTSCDVRWHGTDPVCWVCGSTEQVTLSFVKTSRDAATPEPESDPTAPATPLTRWGPRAEDALVAASAAGDPVAAAAPFGA